MCKVRAHRPAVKRNTCSAEQAVSFGQLQADHLLGAACSLLHCSVTVDIKYNAVMNMICVYSSIRGDILFKVMVRVSKVRFRVRVTIDVRITVWVRIPVPEEQYT